MQNWDCQSCSDCCRIEAVITDEEKHRIEGLDLANDPEVAPKPWFEPMGRGSKKWRLAHRPEGGCVFLTTGEPLPDSGAFRRRRQAIRMPLVPFRPDTGGQSLARRHAFLLPVGRGEFGSPGGRRRRRTWCTCHACWSNMWAGRRRVRRLPCSGPVSSFPGRMCAVSSRCWWRSCKTAAILWSGGCANAWPCLASAARRSWENLQGHKVTKYLQAVRDAMDAEVPREAADLPPPDRLFGGVLFRALLAIFAGRDRDVYRASGIRRRLGRVLAGWRFVRGRGPVPRVNEFLPETSFEEIERARRDAAGDG